MSDSDFYGDNNNKQCFKALETDEGCHRSNHYLGCIARENEDNYTHPSAMRRPHSTIS